MNDPKQAAFTLDGTKVIKVKPDGECPLYNEQLGQSDEEDPRETWLRELAATYRRRCDMFNEMIAPKGHPRNGKECRAMKLHEAGVKDELLKQIPTYERASFRYYLTERAYNERS